jgi:hypothetical protein
MNLVSELRQLTFDKIFGREVLVVRRGIWRADREDMGDQVWVPLRCSPYDKTSPVVTSKNDLRCVEFFC